MRLIRCNILVGIRLTLLRRSAVIYTVIFDYVTFFSIEVEKVIHLFGREFSEKKGSSSNIIPDYPFGLKKRHSVQDQTYRVFITIET